MGSENTAGNVPVTTVVHKFGDEEFSDVTFIVGEEEFKCHKSFLATRSSYFKAMFFSNFKEKDQDKVNIQADPVAFKRLMELIYTAQFTGWKNLMTCASNGCNGCTFGSSHSHGCGASAAIIWNDVTALLQLAELFDVRPYTVSLLDLFSTYNCKCVNCPRSGAKLLIAVMNDMQQFKKNTTITRIAVIFALRQINKESIVPLNPMHLEWLLMRPYFTMGSNTNPVTVNPMIHNFGDERSSDVTFVIGTEEFKCHKKLLSERSSYFNALFNSGFKEKDQSRVFIHEDPIGFEMILDILYMERCYFVNDRCCKRSSTYRSDACTCKRRRRARRRPRFSCCISYNLWSQYTMLLRLTDKYDILDDIAKLIEDGFVEYDRLWLKDPFCICDGIKHLIATFFHMEKFRATRPVPLDCLGEVLTVMTDFQPDLQFEMGHLEWLLGDQLNKKSSIVLCDMDTDTLSKPIFHNFGVEELSDVTFVVGEEQFKCHKMFLAARSSHFKEMFFNASKIASDFVHLNGDAVVFGQLMEILYNGSFVEWREAVCCQGLDKEKDSMSTCPVIPKLWKTCSSLVKLADNFAVKDHVIAILDNYFMRSKGCTPRSKICICDGAKYIFASVHGLHEYKNTFSVTRDIVARAAGVIKKCDPQLSIDIDTFYSILSNISNTL